MKGQRTIMVVLTLALSLVLAVGLSQAEGPDTPNSAAGTGEAGAAAVVAAKIPIQGRLTDASGGPLNGNYSVRFRLYDAASGGTVLCEDTHTVNVVNGLFNTEMDNCSTSDINGRQLYLAVKVGTDPEMTIRPAIYPVPYAWSLRPGAQIGGSGAGNGILSLYNASGHEMVKLDAQYGVIYLGGSGEEGDVVVYNSTGVTRTIELLGNGYLNMYDSADGDRTIRLDSSNGNIYLGGEGDEGDLVIYDTNGVTPTIQIDGGRGLVELGGIGEDGDIYVRSSANTLTFDVDGATGDVSQFRTGDGLVKAGVFAGCGTSASINYSFNNVGGTITIAAGASAGHCTIDFNFDISDRYFVALALEDNEARGVSCSRASLPDDQLHCFRWNTGGGGVSGQIMVLVY